MKSPRLSLLALFLGLFLGGASSTSAQTQQSYSLLVHPIFTPTQAELVYQPLVDYLNAATDYRFELQTARDFHRYWLDIRRGQRPDLVLEDAHLIALRMQQHGFTPLVRASEQASFSLLTTDLAATELADFVGRAVSSMPAPSLGYLILASWFNNPMQQPVLESSAASWLDAVEIVFDAEAEAAIVPHNLVRRYVNLSTITTSTEFPHLTIAASPDLSESVRSAVTRALLQLHENPEHFGVLHELDIEQFVAADDDEYMGLESWLDFVFSGL
jgi:hypothetical protein